MSILEWKSVCIITGASRGIGEALAYQFAQHLQAESVLILLARTETSLETVKGKVLELPQCKERNIKVIIKRFDQGSVNKGDFDSLFASIFKQHEIIVKDFKQAIIVHNIGTMDQTKYCRNLENLMEISSCFQVNLAGMITLNANFLQAFPDQAKVVVNMSSIAAVKPVKSWAVHCTMKTGREKYFKTLALEEPSIRVLNYGPGPVKTDTTLHILLNKVEDEELKLMYRTMLTDGKFLPPQIPCEKLIKILKWNMFENGTHISFTDNLD